MHEGEIERKEKEKEDDWDYRKKPWNASAD
jgi:hypothetical protein